MSYSFISIYLLFWFEQLNKPQESNGDSSQAAEQVIHVPHYRNFFRREKKNEQIPFRF